jgi:hypothetical protein
MSHICGVSKAFGEWYQKTNKTEDTNKLTLLAFKIIAIPHNTRLVTFIKLLETVSKGFFMNRSQNSCHTFVDWNAGRGEGVKIDNRSIERVEEFKYLGATLTDQNFMQEEINSRLKLGNAYYYSVQNLLSSRLLSRNLKIKIYRTIIFCCGVH